MKRILLPLLSLLLPLALATIPGAAASSGRVVSPLQSWTADGLERFDPSWLHLKFEEGLDVRLAGGRFVDDRGFDLARVNEALAGAAVEETRRTFRHDRALCRAWKARGEARSGVRGPDLSLWFDVRVAGGRAELARLLDRLNACPGVEIAHPAAIAEPAAIRNGPPIPSRQRTAVTPGGTPDFTGQQGYLYDTPVGLDAPAAWSVAGGRGAGMKFIDVEICWTEDHEDFDLGRYFYEGGAAEDPGYEYHGTAVLGEVIGQHNTYGMSGFAPEVQYGVVAITLGEWPEVPQYFQEAVDHLDAGDVWLIELQMFPDGHDATPMEYLQVNYDVIWTGVFSRGVVCVEAGANGTQDLDDPSWGGIFDRTVRDSGAIMVGAGTPTGRLAEWFTNWGSRMDVHAWGSEIVTTGSGDLYDGGTLQTRYTAQFGGTSGASPMITGSALCLQGVARAYSGLPLDPLELRALLHDTGIDHLDPVKEIGPRPDLAAAVDALGTLSAPRILAGPGPAYGNPPRVRVFLPSQDSPEQFEFDAYGPQHFGVNVACGEVTSDSRDRILTGPGPGAVFGPHVRGFSIDGAPIPGLSFLAYGTHKFGVNVAAGDLDGDGFEEIVTGAGPGAVFGPHVRGFDYDGSGTVTPVPGVSFLAYGTHKWGVNVAAGDIDGDGFAEIVTGAGPGTVFGPHVRGWNVDGGAAAAIPGVSFLAYSTHKWGVNVACGDLDGDGMAEIVTAPGPSASFGAQVRGWNYDGAALAPLPGFSFFAWPASELHYGARIFAGADLDGDGREDLVAGAGPDPLAGAPVKAFRYDGSQITFWFSLEAFPAGYTHGATVAAGTF